VTWLCRVRRAFRPGRGWPRVAQVHRLVGHV